MSLQEKIRNIIFYYVKNQYNIYLEENNLKFINENELHNIITKLYVEQKKDLQSFIKKCLKEMMQENYPGALVENIIFEIFQDQEMAVNRVTLEIKKYQEYILTNISKEYEVTVPIDPDYGLGLSIDFFDNDVIVKNYKRNSKNKVLPAEESGLISIGDSLIKINEQSLEEIDTEKKIDIVKTAMKKDFIKLRFRTFYNNEITNTR
jgi:hypothetical protein